MRQVLTRLTRSDAVMALRLLLVDFYTPKAYKAERDEAWESIPGLPGEHLRWHQTARGRSEIVTEDGRVLATVEGGFGAKLPRRVTIGQVTYQVRGRLFKPPAGPRVFKPWVTAPDSLTVLSFTGGSNFDRAARAVVHMPDGRSLRFPVQGTSIRNAVMTATDDEGSPVFHLRQVRNAGSGQQRPSAWPGFGPGKKAVVEILVEPSRQITPEMLLVMATGSCNLYTFFDRPGP
jgi:hypothetical protein